MALSGCEYNGNLLPSVGDINKCGLEIVPTMINKISIYIATLVIAISVLVIIYSGIQMMLSAGDSNKFKKALNSITYAAGSIVFVLVVGALIRLVFTIGR
jgi:hypothetical protein